MRHRRCGSWFVVLGVAVTCVLVCSTQGLAQVTVSGKVVASENFATGIDNVSVRLTVRVDPVLDEAIIRALPEASRDGVFVTTTSGGGNYTIRDIPRNAFIETITYTPPEVAARRNPATEAKIAAIADTVSSSQRAMSVIQLQTPPKPAVP